MKRRLFGFVLVSGAAFLASMSMGCNTVMYGTAPAREGYIYVVGSRQNRPTVWLCPNAPKKGECQVVEVNVED